ncbi:hypothetical protein SLA2020_222130 [Shorea laevis]
MALNAPRDNHFIKNGRADVVALINMNKEQGWGCLVAVADVLDPHTHSSDLCPIKSEAYEYYLFICPLALVKVWNSFGAKVLGILSRENC